MQNPNHIPIRFVKVANREPTSVKIQQGIPHKIYVRAVKGVIENYRRGFGGLFLAVFMLIPWLTYNGNQAVLFDFVAQRFHIFGTTLWPQDLTLLAWLLIVAAFGLFLITAIWGRVWCGFICPQTVFTFLFVWVEEKVEGSRNKRIHLDKQSLSSNKFIRKFLKHSIWLAISLITALTFVAYFYPVKELFVFFFSFNLHFWPLFYVLLFTICTYANAGWMREIMCTHMCPYSRFQSSMFDKDTVTVTYNKARGEKRGPRSQKLNSIEYQAKGLGDCIDCNLCVQVCPTGIDIRNGLQYECINCGACVDACNGVMEKMDYAKGLIDYVSESSLTGQKARFWRPKVVGYFTVFIVIFGFLSFEIYTRPLLDLDVVRDRASLFREGTHGNIENTYTLVLMNKSQYAQTFTIAIQGLEGANIIGVKSIDVKANELVRHPITVARDVADIGAVVADFSFVISNNYNQQAQQKSTFLYL
ncbi:cytochrome c oxidase accessory protein CcoG [Paraglaciecola arctica]|uniref:Protein rdxA n=1 Tax=Paraglaciecola arctica BSs20135 TaxID=493475 RepID=K6YH33_9ALTE|nr:cytochrome c oxidase accessory protein CcoG [Paraglaciecola arctica]GAC17472.1 protein rdxA [Paraglaciecola arctica BSs20135]